LPQRWHRARTSEPCGQATDADSPSPPPPRACRATGAFPHAANPPIDSGKARGSPLSTPVAWRGSTGCVPPGRSLRRLRSSARSFRHVYYESASAKGDTAETGGRSDPGVEIDLQWLRKL
jgi:hypothetical protein